MDAYLMINQIDIRYIFEKLHIWYSKIGDSLFVNDDNKITSWRKCKVNENYINDFSWKWRAVWPPFTFVKRYLKLTDKETFRRFEDNFGIWGEVIKGKKTYYPKKEKKKIPAYCGNR